MHSALDSLTCPRPTHFPLARARRSKLKLALGPRNWSRAALKHRTCVLAPHTSRPCLSLYTHNALNPHTYPLPSHPPLTVHVRTLCSVAHVGTGTDIENRADATLQNRQVEIDPNLRRCTFTKQYGSPVTHTTAHGNVRTHTLVLNLAGKTE